MNVVDLDRSHSIGSRWVFCFSTFLWRRVPAKVEHLSISVAGFSTHFNKLKKQNLCVTYLYF